MSNPYLEGMWLDTDDMIAFNKFGMTLSRLGIIDYMTMEMEEEDDVEDGCRCGHCYVTKYWTGVNLMVGDYYNEWTIYESEI